MKQLSWLKYYKKSLGWYQKFNSFQILQIYCYSQFNSITYWIVFKSSWSWTVECHCQAFTLSPLDKDNINIYKKTIMSKTLKAFAAFFFYIYLLYRCKGWHFSCHVMLTTNLHSLVKTVLLKSQQAQNVKVTVKIKWNKSRLCLIAPPSWIKLQIKFFLV